MNLPHWMTSRAAVVASFAFALTANVAVVVTFVATHHSQSTFQRCEAQWEQSFYSGYKARYDASLDVSEAMDNIVQGVADGSADQVHMAVADYQNLRAEQKSAQAKNPLPPLPSEVCGPAKDAN